MRAGPTFPVALEPIASIGVVQGPLGRLLRVGDPSDRRPSPLGTNEVTPRWSALEDREPARSLVDLHAHLVTELGRRLVVRPPAHAIGVEFGDHPNIISPGTRRFRLDAPSTSPYER